MYVIMPPSALMVVMVPGAVSSFIEAHGVYLTNPSKTYYIMVSSHGIWTSLFKIISWIRDQKNVSCVLVNICCVCQVIKILTQAVKKEHKVGDDRVAKVSASQPRGHKVWAVHGIKTMIPHMIY